MIFVIRKYLFYVLFIFVFSFAVNAKSKMPEVLKYSRISKNCKIQINKLSEKLIDSNEHRIIQNNSVEKNFFESFLYLKNNEYKSHINISAFDNGNNCNINYNETFTVNKPCINVKMSFIKNGWTFLGRLSRTTTIMRLDFPKDRKTLTKMFSEHESAYLTNSANGKCLVTKKQYNIKF